MTTRPGARLSVEGVSVRFGGVAALSDVSFTALPGEITGLIGPNGAGKTTTFDVLCGLQTPTSGRISLDDVDLTDRSVHQRAGAGLGRTFQRLETFSLLTVRENLLVGAELRPRRATDETEGTPRVEVDAILDRLGLADVADVRVDTLPTGRARLVELGRALANKPRVLLLDEPSSGLGDQETAVFAAVITSLAAEGMTIVLVEHDMELVMGVCARIHVLDTGRVIASGTPGEIRADPTVATAYLGDRSTSTRVTTPRPTRERVDEPPMLALDTVSAGYGGFDVVHDVSLQIATGEVLALLGPNGAGKSTLLRVASGLMTPSSGRLELCGVDVTEMRAEALARAGVCTVPEGRGIYPNLTVTENLRVASLTGTPFAEITEVTFGHFPELARRRTQLAGTMSGGEQQMLSMARALATDPAVVLIDELSMGLAPIVVSGLYERVAALAATGLSILVVEQFAHEVLAIADRAAILLHGRVAQVGDPAEIADALDSAYLTGTVTT